MSTITVGSTINIQFSFSYSGELVTPDTITGEIFKGGLAFDTFNVTEVSTGIYNYIWTTTEAGSFELRLTGSFISATPDIVHRKYFLIGDTEPTSTIDASYVITLLGILSPVYVDPEYILQYYPSGDLTEITEIIHRKSLELESKLGCTNLTSITSIQHDFIVAATMCELSRIYGLTNGGLSGFTSAASFKLGDLEVDKGSNGGRLPSGSYDLGNAGSWCEMAAALKSQLLAYSDTFRPVVPGAIYPSVVASRVLASEDYN